MNPEGCINRRGYRRTTSRPAHTEVCRPGILLPNAVCSSAATPCPAPTSPNPQRGRGFFERMNRGISKLDHRLARGIRGPDLDRVRRMILFPLTDREHAAVRWLGRSMWLAGLATIAALVVVAT